MKSSSVGKGQTTAGGVPASDQGGSSNVREWWQVLEGFEALGQQAVLSVRALNRGKQLSTIVINRSQETCVAIMTSGEARRVRQRWTSCLWP